MNLVDSHIHLDFSAFDADREVLLAKAESVGIEKFIVPATTRSSWPLIKGLAQSNRSISAAYGIHPYFVQAHSLNDCEALEHWLDNNVCVAVGEIGLDYFLKETDPNHQMKLFDAQLAIARKYKLPVILHARKAVEAVLQRLKAHGVERGIVHSFNGSEVQAGRLIDIGFKLGFGGALTYPRATRLRALLKKLPLTAICLETDAPDQPSLAFRGRRNSPLALLEVLDVVSALHDLPSDIVAQQTTENTYAALNFC